MPYRRPVFVEPSDYALYRDLLNYGDTLPIALIS
jgi:hypothetical protein